MITRTALNEITLEEVKYSKKDLLKNLMTLYLHDLSLYSNDLDINDNGLFEYNGIDLFWQKYYKMNSIEYIEKQITTKEGDKCNTQIFSV